MSTLGLTHLQQAQASKEVTTNGNFDLIEGWARYYQTLFNPGPVLRKPIVCTMGHCYTNSSAPTYSNGVETLGTYRRKQKVTTNACDIQCVFGNQSGDTATVDIVTYTASIEYPSGTIYPLTFNGASSVAIAPNGIAISDPVGIDIVAGQDFWTRTCPHVTAGGKWPTGPAIISADAPAGYTTGSDLTTVTTAVTTGVFFTNCPMAILGTTNPGNKPVIAILGDSIPTGYNEATNVFDHGYIVAGLNDQFGYMRIAKGTETAQTFATMASRFRRMMLINGCTHAICEYGVNDTANGARTLVQVQADLTTIWNSLAQRGMKVFQNTITPYTTSTDSWATLGNQTVFNVGKEAVRVSVNDWIRTNPAPLTNYFDIADAVETGRNSGKWKTTGVAFYPTNDGLHLATGSVVLAATAINTALFV